MVRGDCFEVLFLSSLLYRYQYPLFFVSSTFPPFRGMVEGQKPAKAKFPRFPLRHRLSLRVGR